MGKYRYGVILDAGSSGTRVHVYRWLESDKARSKASKKELNSLPKLVTKDKWTKKIHPGVSTFGENPTAVGEKHLKELLDHALTYVPSKQVKDTPLFLMATAGVRLLPKIQQLALLREICSYAILNTKFSLPDCNLHRQAIDGQTEGLYGWIAANYLVGGFDSPDKHEHGKGHHTYGFLDMGGASAQIAFMPNSTEADKHATDLKFLRMRNLNGATTQYKVFVASWLGFGMNQARERYIEALEESYGNSESWGLPDPCLPAGLTIKPDGDVIDSATAEAAEDIYLEGQGLFDECLRKTYPLLHLDAPCPDLPCLINGQHVPAIDFDVNHFIGVSEYWHSTHGVFDIPHSEKAYDFYTFQSRVNEFCSQDWAAIEKGVKLQKWGEKVDAKTAMETCFKASWLINVLHDGIGIPRVGLEESPKGINGTKKVIHGAKEKGFLRPFQAVDKINGVEVSWTLGKMVLYAAGQIKPIAPDIAQPVGFGNNTVTGLPTDFHLAGSHYSPLPPEGDDDDDDEDLADSAGDLIHKAPRKATSGFILFMLIFLFVGYFFRKPERRRRAYRKFSTIFNLNRRPGSPRKGGRGFFTSTLFGRGSGNYERVLEDGDAPTEFELRDVDSDDNDQSDSSDGSRAARSSGLATPKLNIVNYSESGSFDVEKGSAAGVGLNVSSTPNAMDRSGLVVRTESREKVGGGIGSGRTKSRTGSPTRKSALMRAVGEDD